MIPQNKETKEVQARTTALEIIPPAQFEKLEQHYLLVKYILPKNLVFEQDKYKYIKLHHAIRENFDVPYRVFTNDETDGNKHWSLYALFPAEKVSSGHSKIPILNYDGESLLATQVPFSEPKLHVLVKLMQVAYTHHTETGWNSNRFVGAGNCYIYVSRSGESGHYHTCLELEIIGDRLNENMFYVEGHARKFALVKKINAQYISRDTYFTLHQMDNMILFDQVKLSAVHKVVDSSTTITLYKQTSFPGKRTTLDFHSIESQDETEQTRGYLLDTFINGFSNYLYQYGFHVKHVTRSFRKFEVGETASFTPKLTELDKVFVYDARFSKIQSLEEYLQPLRKHFIGLEFEEITSLDSIETAPVIIFEDCEAKAFQESMPLHGEIDPHVDIYARYPHTPKQFINVNNNELPKRKSEDEEEAGMTREDYLSYDRVNFDKAQLTMLMYQLYLKTIILNKLPVSEWLPITSDIMYVHREHRIINGIKRRFEVALFFENDQAVFLDLENNMDHKNIFYDLMDTWGVGWEDGHKQVVKRRRGNEDGKELPDFDIIVGPNLFVEITGANEAILYDYEEILRRHEEILEPLNPDDLKLSDLYDDIIADPDLTKEMLQLRGYMSFQMRGGYRLGKFKNRKHKDAIELYENLLAYDDLLEELKKTYPAISFYELTTDQNVAPHIVTLFGSDQKLRNLYKKIGKFKGLREADIVSVYTGIWYTEDFRYVVGDPNAMNTSQARAHRVRQFNVYQGKDEFDITTHLDAMSVTFIRLNQYTVLPFYFSLIDIYIDTVLRSQYRVVNRSNLDEVNSDLDES